MKAKSQHTPTAFLMKSLNILIYGAEKTTNSIAVRPAKKPLLTLLMRKYAGIVDRADINAAPTFTPNMLSLHIREKRAKK